MFPSDLVDQEPMPPTGFSNDLSHVPWLELKLCTEKNKTIVTQLSQVKEICTLAM